MASPETSGRVQPYNQSRMARYLDRQIDALKGEVSQRDIAAKLGYPKSNIISMFKKGEAKVPLDKIPALADALHVDIGHLMRLGLEQYWPDKLDVITKVFSRAVTENEYEIVETIRKASHDTDPKATAAQKAELRRLFASK
jgi:transcriptional regulator with XRE-family HTH domain